MFDHNLNWIEMKHVCSLACRVHAVIIGVDDTLIRIPCLAMYIDEKGTSGYLYGYKANSPAVLSGMRVVGYEFDGVQQTWEEELANIKRKKDLAEEHRKNLKKGQEANATKN